MTDSRNRETNILIIDDEPQISDVLSELLREKYGCATTNSAEEALSLLEKENFNLVVSDIDLGGISGIELIPLIHKKLPDAVVIMISGKQSIESAIEAMRVGAFDYIQKPFELEHVEIAVERAINHHLLLVEKRRYENQLEELVRQRTSQLNYLAYHDALTDLPNRALFEDRLSQALAAAQRNQNILAVILLSIDRFKQIHDTLGHAAGHQILRQVAERLKKCAGEEETVARFEGEEFALLLTRIDGAEDAATVSNSINAALKLPLDISGNEVFITAGIGISQFPDDGEDAAALLKNAGAALSRAKEQGGNNFQFYTTDMNAKALRRLELENKLRRALEREEFEVYYQPKIDTVSNRITGMEALARWRHPELGLISPAEFVPLAEETGLILPIGEWILRAACAQSERWRESGFDLFVSVNLSARQFQQQNLSETLSRIVRETKFDPFRLTLEVTESSIMSNPDYAIKTLGELKNTGIKISIDDFGTGYSSLGYLKSLPIDILKIDKSFIRDITTDPDDAALVMAIVTLSHNLRLRVIAEGVETDEQLRFLRLTRCDEWQGFLFSKPIPAEQFEKLLREKYK